MGVPEGTAGVWVGVEEDEEGCSEKTLKASSRSSLRLGVLERNRVLLAVRAVVVVRWHAVRRAAWRARESIASERWVSVRKRGVWALPARVCQHDTEIVLCLAAASKSHTELGWRTIQPGVALTSSIWRVQSVFFSESQDSWAYGGPLKHKIFLN